MNSGQFKKGQPRPPNAGRRAGVPNRLTRNLGEVFENRGVNPAERLLDLMPSLDPAKQADLWMRLLDFVWPRRKAIETTAPETAQADTKAFVEEIRKAINDPANQRTHEARPAETLSGANENRDKTK